MITYLNSNAGAVTALATIALLAVTGWYAWTTRSLLKEAQANRIQAGRPRIVAYLRPHEVHSNLVQLCIANLSAAAAVKVSAAITRITDWPEQFDLHNSKILRDLKFMRPHEVLKFDIGAGVDLFRGEETAIFRGQITFASLDGERLNFDELLMVESVTGHGNWEIYGIDDIARRLTDISDTLKSFGNFKRLQVDSYSANDRDEERHVRQQERERLTQQQPGQSSQRPAAPVSHRRRPLRALAQLRERVRDRILGRKEP